MRTALPLITAALVAALSAQAADIYRWKDANGIWQYSDRPVAGAERIHTLTHEPIQDRPATPAPPAGTAPTAPAKGTVDRTREDVATDKVAKCKEAQANYQQMIAARRVFKQGPKGEQVYLTDDEIDAARVTARANMEYYCGK